VAKVKNRGLGSLYVILAIHVVLILALSPLTNAIPPIELDHAFTDVFLFELAPNFFADCTARSFLFYVDSAGNRRQGSFTFDQASLFTQFDLVSRATGITIESFEVDTSIKCTETLGVTNFDMVPTSSLVYSVRIDDKDGNAQLVLEKSIDPTAVAVGTRQFSTTDRSIDVQNKEVQLATFTIPASVIEEKIDPNKCSIFGCATGSTPTQSFRTQVRIITDYSFDFDIIGVKWEAFGKLSNGYNVNFVDTDFTGTVEDPKSTDIIIKVIRPTGGVFSETGTRLLEVKAFLPDWQTGEGAPTITVKNDDTQGTISSQVLDLAGTEAGSTVFSKRIVLPSSGYDTLKVLVSINGRVTATTFVETFEAGGGGGNGGTTTCNLGTDSTGSCIQPTQTCESKNLITSSFLGIGSFCVPPNLAFIFQGFNILWLTAGFVVFLIVIAVISAIVKSGGGSRVIVRSAMPTGF
jgi:hypothetical protein